MSQLRNFIWMARKLFIFACLVAFGLLLPGSLKRWTHSFHVSRLLIDLPVHSTWDVSSNLSPEDVRHIFSQEFYYLGRGSQAFVFRSQDQDYVLKLFILEDEPHAVKIMQASQTAMLYVPQETGLLYVHLNPGSAPSVILNGPAWHRQTISLDRFRFVLQRRASSLKQALLACYEKKDQALFNTIIESFCSVLHRRISFGIYNSDSTLFDNFGMIDGQVVEIDFGNYVYCPDLFKGRRPQEELDRYASQLLKWVGQNMPEWRNEAVRRVNE